MTLKTQTILNTYHVTSLMDFINQLDLKAQALAYYGTEDYYESDKYSDDDTDIAYWLELSPFNYTVKFIDDGHNEEYWIIQEVE